MKIVTRIFTIINYFDSDITMKGFSLVSSDFQKNHLDFGLAEETKFHPAQITLSESCEGGLDFLH